jgi:hypothetical protein
MESVFRVTDKAEELKELKLLAKRLTRENAELQYALDQKMYGAFWIDVVVVGLVGLFIGTCLGLTVS